MKIKVIENGPFDMGVARAIALVRADPKIGRGTCAMVDECMDDGEVLEHLAMMFDDSRTLPTPEAMLRTMLQLEKDWRDREADVRGEIF